MLRCELWLRIKSANRENLQIGFIVAILWPNSFRFSSNDRNDSYGKFNRLTIFFFLHAATFLTWLCGAHIQTQKNSILNSTFFFSFASPSVRPFPSIHAHQSSRQTVNTHSSLVHTVHSHACTHVEIIWKKKKKLWVSRVCRNCKIYNTRTHAHKFSQHIGIAMHPHLQSA